MWYAFILINISFFVGVGFAAPPLIDQAEHGVRLAEGFRIEQFANEQMANDAWSLTLDPEGRVVVSGAGYIKTLHDADGDGRAETATLFAKHPGAMGLCFDRTGTQLLVMGGGWLSRFTDADRDGISDGAAEKILPFGGGEHGGHAIRQGPDGWWYIVAGNDAGVNERHITHPDSPIKKVEAGAFVRLSPDFKQSEVIAHGFRNPYDFDFNAAGHIFTYDSDTERDYFLPWYSGCRIYHVARGGHHGWRLKGYQRSFRRPDYAPDTVPALADLGRGSPTGVVCYRQRQFPERYRGNLFVCDWTFGKIHHVRLKPEGASYRAAVETFLEPIGTHGFAPTDCVVAPDGALFVSIGGRKTRGAIYRISFSELGVNSSQPDGRDTKADENDPAGSAKEISKLDNEKRPLLDEFPAERWDAGRARAVIAALREARDAGAALVAVRRAQLLLGDCQLERPTADAFAAVESVLTCPDETVQRDLIAATRPHLTSRDARVIKEAARLLAMLDDNHPETSAKILAFIDDRSSPTTDFHYLAVIAKLRAPHSSEIVERLGQAILDLDRKLDGADRRPKQMWPVRLAELVAQLIKHDVRIADVLIAAPGFARPSRIGLVPALGARHKETAARLFFEAVKADLKFEWSPALAGLLRTLPGPDAESLIREREPRVPAPAPIRAEDRLRWEKILSTVRWESGDAAKGEKIYRERTCSLCHGGATTFGPDLAGAALRFSPTDLFRAIVFPDHDVAEAFRATTFHLRDGTSRSGLVAFYSADGVIIQSGPNLTERLPEQEIVARGPSASSLMPAGLLEGLEPDDLADLHAYLKALRAPGSS